MNTNQPFDLQLLWEKTNFGLDYFHEVYPDSIGKENKNKHFKTHSENTASSTLSNKNNTRGLYCVYNHSNKEGFNMIDHCIKENHFNTPGEAFIFLFKKYGLPINNVQLYFEPKTVFSAEVKHKAGYWNVNWHKKIIDTNHLKNIIPFYTDELLKEYNFGQINYYENVGTNSKDALYHRTVTATPEFPIYGYKENGFVKIYQPVAYKGGTYPNGNKNYNLKHSFVGVKPQRHIYGWDRIFAKVDFEEIQRLYDLKAKAVSVREKNDYQEQIEKLQLDCVIMATGGTDGLNIASLGFNVIWFNSEAEIISKEEYLKLSMICKMVYYCPDLDKTGVDQAVKMGLKLLKIKMIWLPEWLKEKNKKDAADWVREHKNLEVDKVANMFRQLLSQALEFQFWEKNDKGTYSIHGKIMLQFLKYNGFYIHRIENTTADATKKIEEKIFVHVKNNIAKQTYPSDIKAFVLKWLEDNFINVRIYNMVLKSIFFSERSSLMSLPIIEMNTKSGTRNSQLYFFQDDVVKVTDKGLQILSYEQANVTVWDANVIKRKFKQQEAPFKIYTNEAGKLDIKITNKDSNYFKVLINTSRVFWQKDCNEHHIDTNRFNIESDKLSDTENDIQKNQLINKIFCVGHLAHKYKIKSKSYCVLGIDRKIGKNAKDNKGGSGKSFIIETIYHYLKNQSVINGRGLNNKDDDKFMLDGITKETDLLYIEDLSPYYDINKFFNHVTGKMTANHKGGKMIPIEFEDFPKLAITMNSVPYDITDSFRRRTVVFECSDYYHEIGEEYHETRTIASDFNNRDLFDKNYSLEEWQNEDNFVMACLQFYLTQDTKIEVFQSNMYVRNILQKIGEKNVKYFDDIFSDLTNFEDFSHTDNHGDLWIYKRGFYDNYKQELGHKAVSNQDFKEILELYFLARDYNFVMKKKKIAGTGNTVEHYTFSKEQLSVKEDTLQTKNELDFLFNN